MSEQGSGESDDVRGSDAKRTGQDRFGRLVSRSRRIDWPVGFAVVALLIGLSAILIIPPVRGPDEFAHFLRISTIEQGWVVAPDNIPTRTPPAGYTIDGCDYTYLAGSYARLVDVATTKQRPHWGAQFEGPGHRCLATSALHFGPRSKLSNTEINSPVPYIPAVVGYAIGHRIDGVWTAFYLARLFQLLAYIVLVSVALRILPWGRPFMATVALLPAAILDAATLSADPVTIALAFVLIATTLRFVHHAVTDTEPAPTSWLVGLGVTAGFLALAKSAAVPLLALPIVIPTVAYGTLRRRAVSLGSIVGVPVVLAATWALTMVGRVRVTYGVGADSVLAAQVIRAHPKGYLQSVGRGVFNLTELHTGFSELITVVTPDALAPIQPFWLIAAVIVALVAARLSDPWMFGTPATTVRGSASATAQPESGDVAGDTIGTRRRGFEIGWAIAVFVVGFLVIYYGVAISWNQPGVNVIRGVQGRYFLPYLPLILFGAGGRLRAQRPEASRVLAGCAVATVGAINVWWLAYVRMKFWA